MSLTQNFYIIAEKDIPTISDYNEKVADGDQTEYSFDNPEETIQYGDFLHGYLVHNGIVVNRNAMCSVLYPGEREELTQKLEASKNITDTQELSEMFPMIEGFFFGSGEYDEKFRENVDKVLEFFATLDSDDLVAYLADW